MMNRILGSLAALALLSLSACGGPPARPPLEGAAMGGDFALTSDAGKPVTSSDFNGKYRLVYFGYTFCPNVCPTDMSALMQGFSAFEKQDGAAAAKVQPLFFTVDPARDTPEALAVFVKAFHPRLIGLTGSAEEIARVVKAYGGFAQAGEKRPDGGYDFDHTRNAVLYGPDGKPIAIIAHDKGAAVIAAELARWVK